jgi:phage terminase large subunit GpA-like protein
VQGILGTAWRAGAESIQPDDLRTRLAVPVASGGYRVGELPEWALCVVIGLDVQARGVWRLAVAFGERGLRRAYAEHSYHRTETGADLIEIDAVLAQAEHRTRSGRVVPVVGAAIDHGHRSVEVERLVDRVRGRVGGFTELALAKGESPNTTTWSQLDGRTSSGRTLMRVNTGYWKDAIHNWLTGPLELRPDTASDAKRIEPLAIPEDVPVELLRHLTSEQRIRVRRQRRDVLVWEPRPGRPPNHLLDCWIYAEALAARLGVGELVGQVRVTTTEPKPAAAPQAAMPAPPTDPVVRVQAAHQRPGSFASRVRRRIR